MANAGSFRKGEKRPNQGKHGPPKATIMARQAIGMFVDDNADRLQGWLDSIANGVPKPGEEGEFIIAPNPVKAFELFQSVIEYHVPKLQRTEHTGANGGPVQAVGMSMAEFRAEAERIASET